MPKPLAVQFNQTHMTEAIFGLAMLLDAEGFEQAQMHSIVVPIAVSRLLGDARRLSRAEAGQCGTWCNSASR